MKKLIKNICMSALAGVAVLSITTPAMANIDIASGSAIISENDTITETIITSDMDSLFRNIQNGTLTGTWSHGNSGTNFFSTVIGSSQNNNTRAEGRGSVINGNGTHDTGGWQAPGVASRGSAFRTAWGTNESFWDLRRP